METFPTKILLIEDDEEDYILLQKVLAKIPDGHYELLWEYSYASGLARMLEGQHDLCMLDYWLGAWNGIDLIRDARRQGYRLPIVLLTGASEGQIDIQALQAGADDYIAKEELQGALLRRVIRYAIERNKVEYEREILRSEQMAARELEKRRSEFISMVVHELKTPLTSLKGYAQLLQRRFSRVGDEQLTQLARRMDTQVNKLDGLISDFQDMARIEAGRLQFRESHFPFDELVTEIVEDLQLTIPQQKILREGQTCKMIWGDRMRIGQVITNLLTNATKYAPNSDRIIVRVSCDEQNITLVVQDFGPGIPEKLRTKIFDPFYRIGGTDAHTAPGLGLGLYISSEIIARHQGRIWVESSEGQGASFSFTLPLTSERGGQEVEVLPEEPAGEPSANQR